MLEARGLSFGYGGVAVGSGLDLLVRAGEGVCLIGPNGAGKSALLKTMLGVLPALAGEVLLDGQQLSSLNRRDVAKALGYVPQAHAMLFSFSVLDMVVMGRAAHLDTFATPGAGDREAGEAALAQLGISHLAAKPYTQISGGERQLVLIARALTQAPRCLIMDEPAANLDLGNQARVLEKIGKLTASGLTVLFSSHDPNHAFACADRVALMSEGRFLSVGVPRDVMTGAALTQLYGAEVEIVTSEQTGRAICAPKFARAEQAHRSIDGGL